MIFSPRISTRELAQLCHRLGISIAAGIDARTMWTRETEMAKGRTQSYVATINRLIKQGSSISDALKQTGDFFPVLFHEMVAVGEQTGRLDAILAQLAEHYQNGLKLRRQFLVTIIWPVIELAVALAAIGFLIWIMGVIRASTGASLDPVGLGLYGNKGLAVYLAFIFGAGAILWFTVHAMRRGLVWTRPIQYALMRMPMLGKALETLALARLAWSMDITVSSGMDIRRAIRLSLASTNNAKFTDKIESIDAELEQGVTIHEAFVQARCFPLEFLDAVDVGERSGKLDQSMSVLSRQYRDQAQSAFKVLNTLAAFLVWLLIAAFIIMMIFRLAFFYIGAINQALGQ
jgi:type II secretory pathway component PulF